MQAKHTGISPDSGFGPSRLLLSFCIQPLLLLAFLSKQFFNFDFIGLSHGFSHPLMGWDHLLTMLAVGIWAAQLRGKAIWVLPLAFVGVMSLGGLAGAAGWSIPSLEGIILLSCAVFSLLIAHKVRFSAKINVLIVAFFAFFHGFAHGQEISTSASLMSYTAGFVLSTLLLHGAGILVAKLAVFSLTCLLTVCFSSAAIAQAVDGEETRDAAQVGLVKVYNALPAESRSDPAGGILGFIETTAGRFVSPEFAQVAPLKQTAKSQMFAGAAVWAMEKPASVCFRRDAAISRHDCNPPLSLGFKRHFPDINQTPGKRSLSNGVGLTSPPLAIMHLSHEIFPLGHFPHSRIEEPVLPALPVSIKVHSHCKSGRLNLTHEPTPGSRLAGSAIPGSMVFFMFLLRPEKPSKNRGSTVAGLAGKRPDTGGRCFESSA
ncbi:HupE/UreJ family protein [Methylomonas sp. SURF-2]|uniref:HupE/UreJ family protein n=1 Tax=Methylomonas subterranea TaxID=2952225 RepID=A0ABT1TFX6_9GAMM|nr:HupE/UreJ family protein [Methylomonas sp. SURF-2]MCQ8104366.1 HupE/UreJ family protein [Methylomonas sp. SURF-2]